MDWNSNSVSRIIIQSKIILINRIKETKGNRSIFRLNLIEPHYSQKDNTSSNIKVQTENTWEDWLILSISNYIKYMEGWNAYYALRYQNALNELEQ